MKKYFSNTQPSLNIILPSGANRRISFSALTSGGSVYYTSDPDIIHGLERHYKFGTQFRLVGDDSSTQMQQAEDLSVACQETQVKGCQVRNDGPVAAEPVKLKMVFTDLEDAKDYLCRFRNGQRTKLRFRESVEAALRQGGIDFEFSDKQLTVNHLFNDLPTT